MNGGNGERIEVWNAEGFRRVQRWQSGHLSHWQCRHVTLGVLPDGRWVVDHTDVRIGARAYPSEARARQAVAELMARGGWSEVPAEFGADGQPTTSGWVRRGGTWFREG